LGVLHFAGHGFFDERNPYRSGFLVDDPGGSLRRDPWGRGFGLFSLSDVMARLDLRRCRLAVLSACHTGLSRIHPAAEFTSLPAGMLIAGARCVVASLWPAHDQATALLMKYFYAGLGDAGTPAKAFAMARKRLRTMSRAEAVAVLGTDADVPAAERPFDRPIYAHAFQLYGTH
jgi:CHAT domain-containing protein